MAEMYNQSGSQQGGFQSQYDNQGQFGSTGGVPQNTFGGSTMGGGGSVVQGIYEQEKKINNILGSLRQRRAEIEHAQNEREQQKE